MRSEELIRQNPACHENIVDLRFVDRAWTLILFQPLLIGKLAGYPFDGLSLTLSTGDSSNNLGVS